MPYIKSIFKPLYSYLSIMKIQKLFILSIFVTPLFLFSATTSITNSTSSVINDKQCFIKTFNFSLASTTITKVMFEVNIDHTWRDDLEVRLTSPAGTNLKLIKGEGDDRDNLYVVFRDDASISIKDDFINHNSTVNRIPEKPLSDFINEDPQGTWELEVCDNANGDNGTYNFGILTIDYDIINQPPVFTSTPTTTATEGTTYNYSPTATDPDGDTITFTAGSLPSWLTFNGTTLSGTPTVNDGADVTITLTADDGNGGTETQTFTISVTITTNLPPIFTSTPVTNVLINTGYNYQVTTSDPNNDPVSVTVSPTTPLPAWLTFNGTQLLSGTAPTIAGTQDLSFIANDGKGGTATQNFTITIVADTNYTDDFVDFHIVNPTSTRNVNGNFAVAGNTVMCLTEKTSGYGGTCHGQNDYEFITSNNHVSKYIDIDGDNSTWNSTSSNITFPADTYEQKGGNGILSAGLFWQGRITTSDPYWSTYYKQNLWSGSDIHYAQVNGTTYNYTVTGRIGSVNGTGYGTINIQNTDSNKIKLKVDTGAYNDVQAIEQFNYASSDGVTYAAYADVTNILRTANLPSGKHTFTVANLTTAEGREYSPGVFGGWSLVVIYAENADGHLRNVTAYHGLKSLGLSPTIRISGFKLPSKGTVSSQATVFSGEGEHLYGKNINNTNSTPIPVDWMKISNLQNSGYLYLPGPTSGTNLGNRDNMFNAQLTNIDRDNFTDLNDNVEINNISTNNNGVDIDLFDVSNIMETYRDTDLNINTVYLKGYSNNDYVTPSMISFSTELYRPNVCYDIAIHRNGFTLPSESEEINATALKGDEISLTIAIKSLESDFDLTNSALAVLLNQFKGHISIDTTKAPKYSPTNSNVLLSTVYTSHSTPDRPEIAIGKDRNALVGGTLGAYERYYSKYYYKVDDVNDTKILSDIGVELNTSIDFGSGPVAQLLPLPRCPQTPFYNPEWLQFNVERHTAPLSNSASNTERYSLYTQVAGQDFDYSVVSYGPKDVYNQETVTSGLTVDVELINADAFNDENATLKCSNPDPSIIYGGFGNSRFVPFNNASRVPIIDASDMIATPAIRNAVFRMWVLVDINNTIIPHTNTRAQGDKFKIIYDDNYAAIDIADSCKIECNAANGVNGSTSCYDCLRKNFAMAICSRDNFAIKPKSYRITLADADVTGNASSPNDIAHNGTTAPSNTASLAAEYPYLLQGSAHRVDGTIAVGYTKRSGEFKSAKVSSIPSDTTSDNALLEFKGNTTNCNDTQHTTYNITFENGVLVDYNLTGSNTGTYDFWIRDNQWTKVDQAENNPYKTIFDASCTGSTAAICNDCIIGDSSIGVINAKSGCTIHSEISSDTDYTNIDISFNPYKFDLSNLTFIRRPERVPSSNIVYFSDLNDSLAMSVGFNGNMEAKGFNDTKLSNFVTGCSAEDIILDTNITTSQIVKDINDVNISFQKVLLADVTGRSPIKVDDENITLDALNFTKDNNGSALVDLYFNFKKPLTNPMNPVDVNVTRLTAISPSASSDANLNTNYIPDGNVSGAEKRFYYARTRAEQATYDDVKEDFKQTAVWTEIYCFDAANVLCAAMGLDSIAYPKASDEIAWYSGLSHDPGDGQVTGIAISGGGSITPNAVPINFTNGKVTNLKVTYSGISRPETDIITVTVSPWLRYATPTVIYRVIFTNDGNWAGIGDTGNVLDTLPKNEENNRVSW
jgi:subtilisin-like proprotein convertase family protein